MTRIRLRRRMTHAATAAISVSSETASQTRQSGQFTKRTRSVPCAPAGRRTVSRLFSPSPTASGSPSSVA